jgi:DNA-binding CsgD family transcriptional regulator
MRQWYPPTGNRSAAAATLAGMIRSLGDDDFQATVLDQLQPWIPAASWSVYRTGTRCRPTLFLSSSHGVPDRTRACWRAYLSGPYLSDRSFGETQALVDRPRMCHVRVDEIGEEHRARVYQPHGMAERVSVVDADAAGTFAVNLYRHEHQPQFTDAQIADFEALAPSLLELARKHIALGGCAELAPGSAAQAPMPAASMPPMQLRERLLDLASDLTARELDVCVRLLQGMTQEGIAADLGLAFTTVKTYRGRAYARLGVHFRNELFARVLGRP